MQTHIILLASKSVFDPKTIPVYQRKLCHVTLAIELHLNNFKKTLFRLKDHFSSWSIWTKRSHVDQYFTINPWTIFDGISINPSSSTHNLLEQRAFSSYLPSFVIIPYSSWKEFLCILYFILPVDPTFGNLILSNITKFIFICLFLLLKVHFGVQQVSL